MSANVFLSIIVPAYNEEKNIPFTLSRISRYLGKKDFSYEVIVVDDGSRDGTVSKVIGLRDDLGANFSVIKSFPNMGKGYVLKKGFEKAQGDFIAFMDADSSVSIQEMDKFLPLLKDDSDIYIASRKMPGSKVTMPLKRKIMGKVYIYLAKLLLGIKVRDINCGFKLFRHKAAKDVFSRQRMNDWSFDAEILHIAGKHGYSIKEVPIDWVYKDTSKVKPFRDAVNSFSSLIKIRANSLKGKYDLKC